MVTLDENNTFQEWAELFLIYKRNEVSNGFFKSLRSAIAHANDFLGMSPLTEITPHQVDEVLFSEKLFNYRNHKPLSRKSIKNIRDVISNIYSFAFENNPQLAIRLYNPAKGRKLPSEASVTTRDAISVMWQRELISNTGHPMYIPVMIFMLCGLRRGELIPLKWTDIDFETQLLSINKTVIEKGNTFVIKSGKAKTKTSIRKIPIPMLLLSALKASLPYATSEFICPNPNTGGIFTPSSWGKSWKDYLDHLNKCYLNKQNKASLFCFTPQILRHTYATILFNAGVDVLSAAKFLGHSNPETTMKIYTHLQKEKVSGAVNLYNVYVEDILSTSCMKAG